MKNMYLIDKFMEDNNLKYDETFVIEWKDGKCTKRGIVIFEKDNENLNVKLVDGFKEYNPWLFWYGNNTKAFENQKFFFDILFSNDVRVIKKRRKPEIGKLYYFIDWDGNVRINIFDITAYSKAMYLIGNYFETEKEALDNKDKILEILNRDEPLIKEK